MFAYRRISQTAAAAGTGKDTGFVVSSRLIENIFFATRGPTQTAGTIYCVVGDEVGPLIVAADLALFPGWPFGKWWSGRRFFQESWSIDFQTVTF